MSYTDKKQELIDTILKNPAGFLKAQFDEGGAFGAGEDDTFLVLDQPVIMRLEYADFLYLTVITWEWYYGSIVKNVRVAHTMPVNNEGVIPWVYSSRDHDEVYNLDGAEIYTDEIALGKAAHKWQDVALEVPCRMPNPEYAWFFPYGTSFAEGRTSMSVYVNNQD